MQRQAAQQGKLGLIFLITAAIVAVVLIVPAIVSAVTPSITASKASYLVGETVTLNVTVNVGAAEEIGTFTTLNIVGAGGSPGPETVTVDIPISAGAQDLTSLLPVDGVTGERGTLTVTQTLTNLGPATGGYEVGYAGGGSGATITMVIKWTPPIEEDGGTGSTAAGDYDADITANGTTSSPVSIEIVALSLVGITVTSPTDNSVTNSTAIGITGTVDDPTVTQVSVGIALPEVVLFGNDAFTGPNTLETSGEQALFSFTQNSSPPDPGANLWHVMTDFSSCPVTPTDGSIALAYTEDSDCNYEASTDDPFLGSSGNADSASFVVGNDTVVSFLTWFNTEPGTEFDKKLIQLVEGGTATTIAQITSEPPPSDPDDPFSFPDFGAAPGTVYSNSFFAPHPLVFLPPPFFLPDPTTWAAVSLDMDTIESLSGLSAGFFDGKTVNLRFRFETGDSIGNDFEGWFVDQIQVLGAGAGSGLTLSVTNLAFSSTDTAFTLAEGSNVFTLTATNGYPTPLNGLTTVTAILDNQAPVVALDTLVNVTSSSTLTISGTIGEANPDLLEVALDLDNDGILESSDKILLSKKSFTTDTTFSVSATLSEGANRILVKLTDKVDLTASDETTVLLDTVAPLLNVADPFGPIYPVGEVSARPGDPIVFQAFATDAASGILKVEFFPPGDPNPEALLNINDVPGAIVDQWQVASSTNFILPVVVPQGIPAGPFSLTVKATDKAGNTVTKTATGTISAALQAFNIYLMPGANLVSTPLIPDVSSFATLLTQKVPNINATFKGTLAAAGAGIIDSDELDSDGDATLANVIDKIIYYTGGPEADSGTTPSLSTPGTFPGYFPSSLFNDPLTTLEVGKGYWIFATDSAFKLSSPLAPGLPQTPAPIKLTITGTFLEPGTVPPVFPVIVEWNLIGLHSEQPRGVENFLDSVVFLGAGGGGKAWSSLLEFLNLVDFKFQLEEGLGEDRVTITQGQFNSLNSTDTAQLGHGFWLFSLVNGSITP